VPRRIPSYRHYKPKNLGLVVLDGRYHYLGRYGTPESLAEYHRLVQEWLLSRRPPTPRGGRQPDLTVGGLIFAYLEHAREYYRHPDGRPTREVDNLRDALRPLGDLYGHTPAGEFGPLALRAVREEMVRDGLCRTVVNARVKRVRRAFRWAASVELIPVSVVQALGTVEPLRRGRCAAPESPGVRPVRWEDVEATLPHLPRPVAAMVRLMRYSNCRAEDAVVVRGRDLRVQGDVWTYRPAGHKNQWREEGSQRHARVIHLGPRAQEAVRPFLGADPEAYLFSPREAAEEHRASRRLRRKTRRTPSELAKMRRESQKGPASRYSVNTFQQAVRRACRRAGVAPWSVLQVRHTRATEVRERYGVEGAQASLGNARVETAQIYAEKNQELARRIARETG